MTPRESKLVEQLSSRFLGEKVPLDFYNVITGEVLIAARRKITKTLILRLVRAGEAVEIDPSPIRRIYKEVVDKFNLENPLVCV